MSSTEEPAAPEEPLGPAPRAFKKRYALLALVVVIAVVLGLRARSKPVATDGAPPEAES